MSRDIDALEREIAETRADLDEALDMLQAKMTPAALIDSAFGAKHRSPALAAGMGHMYAHRPFTTLVMTAGLNWYLARRAEKRARAQDRAEDRAYQAYQPDEERRRVRDLARRARERVKSGAAETRARVAETLHQAEERAAEAAAHTRDSAQQLSETVKDRMHTMSEGARRRIQTLRETTRERSQSVSERARAAAQRNQDRARSYVAAQPLVAGAAALLVGALLAAIIPESARERKALRPLAPKAERLRRKAKEAVVQGVQRSTELATQALDTAAGRIEESLSRSVH